ncbi:hypothetical protein, partial [Burkholderia sp. LMG 13014]|uniref:hypothetical protein n=1 Tax=Burkholderia sp. LMG 13014 TaxID=2709306 RepID=UPI001964AF0E
MAAILPVAPHVPPAFFVRLHGRAAEPARFPVVGAGGMRFAAAAGGAVGPRDCTRFTRCSHNKKSRCRDGRHRLSRVGAIRAMALRERLLDDLAHVA